MSSTRDDEMDNKPTKEFQLWNGKDKLVKQIKESSLASYLYFTQGETLQLTLYWALPYDSLQSFHLVWKGQTPQNCSWGITIPSQGTWKSKKVKLSPHVSVQLMANKKCVSLRSFIFDLKGFPFLQDAWKKTDNAQDIASVKRVRESNEEKVDQIKRLKLEPLEKQIEELQKQKEYWTGRMSFIENHMNISHEPVL